MTIKQGNKRVLIKYIPPQKLRVLVGVEITPSHDSDPVHETHKGKVNQCIVKLRPMNLSPLLLLQEYKAYWWASLKYMVPILSLHPSENTLQPLY